uniref:Mitochondrial ribosome-associated GTPase 1 n=1 Tax=Astatotilapia calliptera TaxID=8154 RepID=A0A3P8NXE6_ASTCA
MQLSQSKCSLKANEGRWIYIWVNSMKLYQALRHVDKFRTVFDFGGREVAHWFPGHMAKGLKQMRANLKSVDCIIEIHDARISFLLYYTIKQNPVFQDTLSAKPHLLILNKMDLADLSNKQVQILAAALAESHVSSILLKRRDDTCSLHRLLKLKKLQNKPRFNREEITNYCLMVIGVPNVGKSSLINSLRRTNLKKGRASRVGGEPGITKAVLTKIQVCERPIMYLLDTPGVLPPKIESVETGMKLALCGTILDHLVGEDIIADYLLYSLNRLGKFSYVDKYDLQEPSDDIQHVLKRIAVKLGKTQRVKAITGVGNVTITIPNYTAAAYDFIRAFRKGELGQVMLD